MISGIKMQSKFCVPLFLVSTLKTVVIEINVRNRVGQFHSRFQCTDSVADYEELFAA